MRSKKANISNAPVDFFPGPLQLKYSLDGILVSKPIKILWKKIHTTMQTKQDFGFKQKKVLKF